MTGLDLNGKIALVTGGGTGVGFMIAKCFAKNGAKVYITGRRLEVLKKAALDSGIDGLVPLQMNIVDKESIRKAVQTVDQNDGKLDILVNNAGIPGPYFHYISDKSAPEHAKWSDTLFEQSSFEDWSKVLQTNTSAPFFVTIGFLTLLERGAQSRAGTGADETSSVINISSAAASMMLTMDNFVYPVSKAGIDHLTKSMATQFSVNKTPVRVNCIEPGFFPSESTERAELVKLSQKAQPGGFNPAPLLRPGKDAELTTAALFLASSAGGFTNGIIMRVDGGLALVNP
ncbi:short-chain dehydrogenase [Dendrothele bispora CBS 962.96]|uniref:Short-chain dehydrogenase n=1 Tax=Dendrothele bispora (strain CBS 962.96) TaxID=1314807 RepID=A0A4S8L9L8_DENBC|nr:short-chain dehydrogenase [Dendrothele bispora CBS 962.96]